MNLVASNICMAIGSFDSLDIKSMCTTQIATLNGTTGETIYIPRVSDIIWLDCIVFPGSFDLPMLQHLKITANGQTLWDIPFKLILKLSNITETLSGEHAIYLDRRLFCSTPKWDGLPII